MASEIESLLIEILQEADIRDLSLTDCRDACVNITNLISEKFPLLADSYESSRSDDYNDNNDEEE
jgi:hypothetical protein